MARNELRLYHNQLQQTLAVFNGPDTLTNNFMPNSPILILNIHRNRDGTLRALGLQYQRMMQAAPLTRTGLNPILNERQPRPIGQPARPDPSPNMQPRPGNVQPRGHGGFNPRFTERQLEPVGYPVRPGPLPMSFRPSLGTVAGFCDSAIEFNGIAGKWQCSRCSFQPLEDGLQNSVCHLPTRDAPRLHLHFWMILISHLRSSDQRDPPLYGCKVCLQAGRFTYFGLQRHLQQHTRHQLKGSNGRAVQDCGCRDTPGRHKKTCAVFEKLACKIDGVFTPFSKDLALHRGPVGFRIRGFTKTNGLIRMRLFSLSSRDSYDIDPN